MLLQKQQKENKIYSSFLVLGKINSVSIPVKNNLILASSLIFFGDEAKPET